MDDLKCPPRCSGHDLRKVYFRFWQNGTPAGVPFCLFHKKGRNGKLHLQRRFLRKRGAAECVAVCLLSPTREKSVWSAPQSLSGQRPSICLRRPLCRLKAPLGLSLLRKRGRSKRKIKNNYSAEDAQSKAEGIPNHFQSTKSPPGIAHGGLWFTVYSALVSGFASALASGFAAGAAAGAAGFTTGFGGLGSSFSGKRMMCLGHFWAHMPQPLHLS